MLPEALHAATERGLENFDAIVVDEAQDFPDAYWLPLQFCLAEPERSVLYVFLDTAQRIYHTESSLISELPHYDLPDNVRNTQAIHAASLPFVHGTQPRCAGPPGRAVEIVALPEGASLAQALPGVVQRLLQEEQFAPEHIAILSGRRLGNVGLSRDQPLAGRPLTGADTQRPGHLTLDTIHRFKGLRRARGHPHRPKRPAPGHRGAPTLRASDRGMGRGAGAVAAGSQVELAKCCRVAAMSRDCRQL